MIRNLASKFFGSRNERAIKKMRKEAARINDLEADFTALSDEQLQAKTEEFRRRLTEGEALDDLLPEAFAAVREASRRTLGMRHFDVQLIGGMVLHQGKIAEMRTGEGKTLVATLTAYLNALDGKGVHVVTVNDYLARRDAEWMGEIYRFLGLKVGVIVSGIESPERREAYAADITYGTNNEFGFDYLRDNMAFSTGQKVQRPLNFAIVDEVDSILIDEARTPLIISGPTDDNSDLYETINKIVPQLTRQEEEEGKTPHGEEVPETGDYTVDEKARQAFLTERGHLRVEQLLAEAGLIKEGESLYDASNINLMHHLSAALRAHTLFSRDVDYIVQNGEVVIVDEFTGRTMPGRRWSEGLHQAVEAKEGVPIQNENQTLASITFQNYFRIYNKLAGMTGTADTEAFEFQQIYGLEVLVIPTHQEMIRDDQGDLVYLTPDEKYEAVCADIRDCVERGQPVLVGTTSIDTSELLSGMLQKENIAHEVLNAKQHEKEARIIAQAGMPGAVTIATNMAGRGTDIVLGGNLEAELAELGDADDGAVEAVKQAWKVRHEQVLASGGLHVIGTERHESRRIDNQLRGRSGRQGDPGSSRFYLSLQDNLMRIFASDRVGALMQKLGMEEGEAIEHPWVTKAIENAQRKVEGRNFSTRKQLLEYDDVANDQRKVIYEQRNELMEAEDISDTIQSVRYDVVEATIDSFVPPQSLEEQWDVPGLEEAIEHEFGVRFPIQEWLDADDQLHEETLRKRILDELVKSYEEKEATVGPEVVRQFEKAVMLQIVDAHWKDHLANMDHLRQGIHLRGYAQKNPKQEYKREAFELFSQMLDAIKQEVISVISRVQVRAESDVAAMEQKRQPSTKMRYHHATVSALSDSEGAVPEGPGPGAAGTADRPEEETGAAQQAPFIREGRKVGRNEPCPCGSGKKFKRCHGRLA